MNASKTWMNRSAYAARWAGCTLVALALSASLGVGCDQDAEAVFRQSATESIAGGVKTALAGDAPAGLGQIVSAIIDGAAASIVQAGDGPSVAQ